MAEQNRNVRIVGRTISPGLVIGPAFVYQAEGLEALAGTYEIEPHQVGDELRRLERAMKTPNRTQVRYDSLFKRAASASPVPSATP